MSNDSEEQATTGPVIRDKRRIDPETGQVRERPQSAAPAPPHPPEPPAKEPAEAEVEVELAERTADLQRVQAEYLNYKRRVDRDRENTRKTAVASTLAAMLPVLDDIARAREHEELTGGFKAIADSLERTVATLGMTSFGKVGDPFDPRIHEALMHSYSDDVDEPVCQAVLQVGYQIGDRIVRPARVAVAEPPAAAATADEEPAPGQVDESADVPDDEVPGSTSYDDNGSA
ncbi:MAG: nucleotide exchange factor GrpE [Nocardioidaceae bacterium]